MGFPKFVSMEEGTVLRKVFFGDKLSPEDEVTPFHIKLFNVYADWKEFKEFPYNRNGPEDQKIPFWKTVVRGLSKMEEEAKRYRNERRRPTEKRMATDPRQRRARALSYGTRKVSGMDKRQGFKQWKADQLKKIGFTRSRPKPKQKARRP